MSYVSGYISTCNRRRLGKIWMALDDLEYASATAENIVLSWAERLTDQLGRLTPAAHAGQLRQVAQRTAHLLIWPLGSKKAGGSDAACCCCHLFCGITGSWPIGVDPVAAHHGVGGSGGQDQVTHLVVGGVQRVVSEAVLIKHAVAQLGPLSRQQLAGSASPGRPGRIPVGEEGLWEADAVTGLAAGAALLRVGLAAVDGIGPTHHNILALQRWQLLFLSQNAG